VIDLLARLLGLVCGQAPGHVWAPAGVPLPVCQRCVGLYAGAALAVALHVLLRPPPSRRSLFLHALCLLPIVPAGLHLFPQGAALRALTGSFFGVGAVHLLWVAAFVPRASQRSPRSPPGPGFPRGTAGLAPLGEANRCALAARPRARSPRHPSRSWALYAALLAASFSAVLALALRGNGPLVAALLTGLSAAGLLALGLLALAAVFASAAGGTRAR